MPKTKLQCPECSTWTLSFLKPNADIIYKEKERLRSIGKKKSFEETVNLMIAEWKTDRDVEQAINNKK